jgi:hypothetical protein
VKVENRTVVVFKMNSDEGVFVQKVGILRQTGQDVANFGIGVEKADKRFDPGACGLGYVVLDQHWDEEALEQRSTIRMGGRTSNMNLIGAHTNATVLSTLRKSSTTLLNCSIPSRNPAILCMLLWPRTAACEV